MPYLNYKLYLDEINKTSKQKLKKIFIFKITFKISLIWIDSARIWEK